MNINRIIPILALSLAVASCQKVIKVDLNSSDPKYVITGNVTDQPGPYTVLITKSVNFDQVNTFPGVAGAAVYITDQATNQTDTLTETSGGKYKTHSLTGVAGHTYSLKVISAGHTFTSSSTMPQPIAIDSIYMEKSIFGDNNNVVVAYNDPVATGNYFHSLLTVKDSLATDIYIRSDDVTNGKEITQTLRTGIDIIAGDSVTVELQCTDKKVYEYYRDLEGTISQNSATPANPQSNIDGGALGYFSANTVNRRSMIVR